MRRRSKGFISNSFYLRRSRPASFCALISAVAIMSPICGVAFGQNLTKSALMPTHYSAEWPKIRQDVQFISGKSSVVSGLMGSQVQVLEDGVEQHDVTLEQKDQPASICLLLDLSSSMKDHGHALITAARKLIAESNPADEFALVSFSGRAISVEQGFTPDVGKIDAALQRSGFGGSSNFFDGLLSSIAEVEAHASKSRRVVIVLSDGDDNYSHFNIGDVMRRLRYPGAPLIYSISPPEALTPNPSPTATQGLRNLLELSSATGGFFFVPEKLSSLDVEATQIAQDIRSRYSLEYASTHTQSDGKLHKLEIKIAPTVSASKIKPLFQQEYYAPSH
jgi:Ca-activated chloride channel homolog